MTIAALKRKSPSGLTAVLPVFTFSVICCSQFAHAADTPPDDLDYPLAVINVASYQRLRDNAGVMFASAERAEMTDRVDQWAAETLKDTKGIDRARPFGLMLYLGAELFGPPMGISYLPVTDLDDALETLAYGTGIVTPVEGRQDRFDIRYTESFKLRTLYQNGYLFLVGPDGNDTSLDRNFPNPEKMTSRLTAQYDIAVSLMIKSIPVGLKTGFLAFFATQAKADLQQRDDEPESVYRLRRANGEGWIDLIEKIVNQGNEVTLGARLDQEAQQAHIDFEIAGTRDSKLAKLFQSMSGKRTHFGNLLENPATFTMSISWQLEEKQRQLFVKYFEAAQKDFGPKDKTEDVSELPNIVEPIFKTLMTTADLGHLDAIAQLTGTEQQAFALIGGVKLATSSELPNQITSLLQYFKNNPNGNELAEKLDLSFDSIDSFPVHRLPINPPNAGGQRLFGEEANLYVYVTPQAVWCAFGGEPALETLKESLQTVALPQNPKQNRNRIPFLFSTHAKNWLSVADDENPNAVAFNERARASFESDNDALTVEVRPTDSGVRVRATLESGFISLMGRGISSGIETGFFNRPRNGQGNRRGRNRENPEALPPNNN